MKYACNAAHNGFKDTPKIVTKDGTLMTQIVYDFPLIKPACRQAGLRTSAASASSAFDSISE
jgi:hypothetical protein